MQFFLCTAVFLSSNIKKYSLSYIYTDSGHWRFARKRPNFSEVVMRDYIKQRVLELADYIIESGSTVRLTAQVFGISKSTVHKDVTERLCRIDNEKFGQIQKLMEINKSERHIRGGEATKQKYAKLNKSDI